MRSIETSRLLLRDWNESDLGNCAVFNDDVIRYLLSAKNNYAIVLKENDKVIGTLGLNEDAEKNPLRRNVGFRLLEQYRNQGYMSEALEAVISTAQEITPSLSYVQKVDDFRSQHIAEKFGFKYVKTFFGVKKHPEDEPTDFKYYILDLR